MGGNAFDGTNRIDKKTYDAIVNLITDTLDDFVGVDNYRFPESVRSKDSFGDVDFIVAGEVVHRAKEAIESTDGLTLIDAIYTSSGYNLMVMFEGFRVQVDLNKINKNDLEFAMDYFSWNDLGNLIGRIAHRQGLKHGHDGLWLVHRDGDQLLGEILVTKNYNEALSYLGFNVEEYNQGFNTFEQMFDWVRNSSNFEESAFPLEHRNHKSRVRDMKRKVYNDFLAYLNFSGNYVKADKESAIKTLYRTYPHVLTEVNALDFENAKRKNAKAKFNGLVVHDLTGLDGKDLGRFMGVLRKNLSTDLIIAMDKKFLEQYILDEFNRQFAEGLF